jgi:hypothetical protein
LPIDKEEEEGLRAFALRVEAHAGASYPERPRRVELGGRPVDVIDVIAQWREEERLGFRVRLEGGAELLLYYVPELDIWSGAGPGDPIVRRRNGA